MWLVDQGCRQWKKRSTCCCYLQRRLNCLTVESGKWWLRGVVRWPRVVGGGTVGQLTSVEGQLTVVECGYSTGRKAVYGPASLQSTVVADDNVIAQMGDSQGNGKRKDYKTWTAEESNALLQLMVEGAMLGFRDINGVISKTTIEAKLLPKLKEKISKEITYSQYQSRVKWFKKQYSNYSQLMRHNSGFGWDPITKRFTAPDEVWADYLKSHPAHAHFQSETFADYEDLKIAVGNGTATGMGSIGLGDDTDATTYDEEGNESWEFGGMDDLVFDQDINAFVQTENANDAPQSRAHGKRNRADYEQSSNSKGVATQAAILENISSGFGEIVTSFKTICGIMEKRESTNSECWIAIQETPGLNNAAQFFAISFLNTKTKQDTFLKMSPDQRLDWITWAQRDA